MKVYWKITVYDSAKKVYEVEVPAHRLSDEQLKNLLRALASRYLTFDETVAAMISRHRGKPSWSSHLEVTKENNHKFKRTDYFCGLNPHVTAIIVKK